MRGKMKRKRLSVKEAIKICKKIQRNRDNSDSIVDRWYYQMLLDTAIQDLIYIKNH